MTTVTEVRNFLNKIAAGFIPDDTIRVQINIAEEIVANEKGQSATEQLVDQAELIQAAYLSYLAYATYIERGTGRVPPPMLEHLGRLEALANKMLEYVKRGTVQSISAYTLTESLWSGE